MRIGHHPLLSMGGAGRQGPNRLGVGGQYRKQVVWILDSRKGEKLPDDKGSRGGVPAGAAQRGQHSAHNTARCLSGRSREWRDTSPCCTHCR